MNLNIALILVLSLSFMACSSEDKPTETSIDKSNTLSLHGISFSLPKGWKKTEAPIPDTGVYIMVEKEGEDESGQFIASILNNKIPLGTYMEVMQEELNRNLTLQNAKIEFSEIKEETFNDVNSLACSFAHNSGGLDFRGTLKAFYCGQKTVYIFTQEAIGDIFKNKDGLQLLHNSFACG